MAKGLVIRAGLATRADMVDKAEYTRLKDKQGRPTRVVGVSVTVIENSTNKADYENYVHLIKIKPKDGVYSVAWLDKLKNLNGVDIIPDPEDGNPYHCLLTGEPRTLSRMFTSFTYNKEKKEREKENLEEEKLKKEKQKHQRKPGWKK